MRKGQNEQCSLGLHVVAGHELKLVEVFFAAINLREICWDQFDIDALFDLQILKWTKTIKIT